MMLETGAPEGCLYLGHDTRVRIFRHALDECPAEACGVLLGGLDRGVNAAHIVLSVPMHNSDPSSQRGHGYSICAADLHAVIRAARRRRLDLLGFYHSHPGGEAVPSRPDILGSTPWQGSYQLIVALGPGGHVGAAAYRVGESLRGAPAPWRATTLYIRAQGDAWPPC